MTVFDVAETDRLLTTTRSVRRRLDLDRPVRRELIEESLDVAVQAPNANDQQSWRWVVITDDAVKQELSEVFDISWRFHRHEAWTNSGRRRRNRSAQRNNESAELLARNISRVPVLVIPCLLGRPPDICEVDAEWLRTRPRDADTQRQDVRLGAMRASTFYGSIFPAIWSFQLALRSRGLGSTITCMHLPFERRVGQLLGIPSGVTQVCMIPVAHTVGTEFSPAKRSPAASRTSWEGWQT